MIPGKKNIAFGSCIYFIVLAGSKFGLYHPYYQLKDGLATIPLLLLLLVVDWFLQCVPSHCETLVGGIKYKFIK